MGSSEVVFVLLLLCSVIRCKLAFAPVDSDRVLQEEHFRQLYRQVIQNRRGNGVGDIKVRTQHVGWLTSPK